MTSKEFLQFLAMMIPTLLLLAALALSLAFPAGTAGAPALEGAVIQNAPEIVQEPADFVSVPRGDDAEFDHRRLGGEARGKLLAV